VYLRHFIADADGMAHSVQLHTEGHADYLGHKVSTLPLVTRWMVRDGSQAALGMTLPGTAEPAGKKAETAKGNLQQLAPVRAHFLLSLSFILLFLLLFFNLFHWSACLQFLITKPLIMMCRSARLCWFYPCGTLYAGSLPSSLLLTSGVQMLTFASSPCDNTFFKNSATTLQKNSATTGGY
jgi:hypothetical protein